MAMLSIEGAGQPMGHVPVLIGDNLGATQTVTQQEIANALTERGYSKRVAAPISPSVSPALQTITPAMTRAEAIKKALDSTLRLYGYQPRCSRLGGCALSESRFMTITVLAAKLATSYLRVGSVTTRLPSITPLSPSVYPATRSYTVIPYSPSSSPPLWSVRGLSPSLAGIDGDLRGLGQDVVVQPPTWPPYAQPDAALTPGMTTWDWVAIISQAAQGVASTVQAYANARTQRERAGQTATLTTTQIKAVIDEALLRNPALDPNALKAAAAGAAGDLLPKGMPGWVLPVVIGSAVVAVMSSMNKRR